VGARAARMAHVDAGGPDRETHERLVEEARKLFAADGYRRVTVRQVCAAARANVAAINYHFGGKYGLYREVLDEAIAVMRQTSEGAMAASAGGTAEQRFRAFVRVFLHRVGASPDSWIRQLMAHELAEPTEALDDVVREVIAPRIDYMANLVAEILGVDVGDERVMRCVLSVSMQFQAAMANPVSKRLVPGFTGDAESLERLAQHIADFSIGGIRAMGDDGSHKSQVTRRKSQGARRKS
jgi:AcrR family transcriptional regulator